MTVDLRVLGSLRLTSSDGREFDTLLRQSKRMALLAYLAAARPRGLHRRDTLLGIFWPELDTAHARSALNQALYVLRGSLGDDTIVTRGDSEVGVHADALRCDATAFDLSLDAGRPEEALALYRGDLLEGFFIAGAPEYERWLDAERARLRQRASAGSWGIAEAKARDGDAMEAARWARRAAELLPADEAVIRRLMTFLHRLGDRASAIRAYEAFVWRLTAEYELEPSPETRALADAIRDEERDPVAARLEQLLPAPFPEVFHRIQRRMPLGWAAAGLLGAVALAGAAWSGLRREETESRPVSRFALAAIPAELVTSGVTGSTVAVSPTGDAIAYLAKLDGTTQLFLRPLDRMTPSVIPHTADAYLPFFSPDGAWVGFIGDGKIRKVRKDRGPAITICAVSSNVLGASWGTADVIVFATTDGLWQVAAAGGDPRLIVAADSVGGVAYRWPEMLPGGKSVLVTRVDASGFSLAVITIATGAVRLLGVEGTSPHFSEPGSVVFARRDGALLAVPFDAAAGRIEGAVYPIAEGITVGALGAAKLGSSRTGTIAYIPERVAERSLMLVDRRGNSDSLPLPRLPYHAARFSPDGRRIATEILAAGGPLRDIWVAGVGEKTLVRVTSDSSSAYPQWSPDGTRIVFATSSSGREAGFAIRSIDPSARDSARTVVGAQISQIAHAISPDGKTLVIQRDNPRTRHDLWIVSFDTSGAPQAYLQSPFDERGAAISPDGRWLAYTSNESGRDEVYVRRFPVPGDAIRISSEGGAEPRWSPMGGELFYRGPAGMMAAALRLAPTLRVTRYDALFNDRPYLALPNGSAYDVHPDGDHFLMIRRGSDARELVVVLNGLTRSPASVTRP